MHGGSSAAATAICPRFPVCPDSIIMPIFSVSSRRSAESRQASTQIFVTAGKRNKIGYHASSQRFGMPIMYVELSVKKKLICTETTAVRLKTELFITEICTIRSAQFRMRWTITTDSKCFSYRWNPQKFEQKVQLSNTIKSTEKNAI